ncbi:peptide deformylase [Streptomyces sp. NBC_00963]|uniref:peptide deformylase n=1 Tax=Streptomyces sp. NBC_00963 TaxID=2903697 RepID=UPI003865D8D8|nr:peptide deformylase [Streptomyces sp. NBC_00963]
MTVRETLQLGDPFLRTPAQPLTTPLSGRARALAADLDDTLADWVKRTGYGRGIAAPQIGAGVRMVHLRLDEPWTLVNPRITERSETTWEPWDACLSFSVEIFCRVRRHTWVTVDYRSPDGRVHTLRADGELSELLQHEIDHLDGCLAVDRMTDLSTLCMRTEFEARHRDESPYRR